jgi:single-strand DNA-binding protein
MINKAILVGRLGADPKVRYTPDAVQVLNFPVATSEWKKSTDGTAQEKTEWHRVIVFGKLADRVAGLISRGTLVYIEGKIRTKSWEDRDGAKRSYTEIAAYTLRILEGKSPSEATTANNDGNDGDDDAPF